MVQINPKYVRDYSIEIERADGTILRPVSWKAQIEEEKNAGSAFIECQFLHSAGVFNDITFNNKVRIKDETGNDFFKGFVAEIPRRKEGKLITIEFDAFSDWMKAQNIIVNKTYSNTLMSTIFKDLINTYSAETGITLGNIDETSYPVESYKIEDTPLWDAINEITDLINFHFEVTRANKANFTRYESTRNYYPLYPDNIKKGTASFQETTANLCNKVHVIGDSNTRAVVEDADSIAKWGKFEKSLFLRELDKEADLKEYGQKFIDAFKEPLMVGSVDVFENREWQAGQLIEVMLPEIGLSTGKNMLRISRIRTVLEKGYVQTSLSFNMKNEIAGTMAMVMRKLRDATKKEKELNERVTDLTATSDDHETRLASLEENEAGSGSGGTTGGIDYVSLPWKEVSYPYTPSANEWIKAFSTNATAYKDWLKNGTDSFGITKPGLYEITAKFNFELKNTSTLATRITDETGAFHIRMKTQARGSGMNYGLVDFASVPFTKTQMAGIRRFTLNLKSTFQVKAEEIPQSGLPLFIYLQMNFIKHSGEKETYTIYRNVDFLTDFNLNPTYEQSQIEIKKLA